MIQIASPALSPARSTTSSTSHFTLDEFAEATGAELRGNGSRQIVGFSTLATAVPGDLCFVADPGLADQLSSTRASAVILNQEIADQCPVDCLVVDNPQLAYARVSGWFESTPTASMGVHPTATVAADVVLGANVSIGPHCCLESGTRIGNDVCIGAGTCIAANSLIGSGSRIAANVTIYHNVRIGNRVRIHSGAVIGADGFGYAASPDGWVKIHQLGSVIVGDDVEIGACTSIDRGALQDTVIGKGVIIDNQVQIAHNVRIGPNTAIAGCVGISGSVTIGANCVLAGGVGIADHLNITDDVVVTAMTFVSQSISEAGVYSSGTAMSKHSAWQRNAIRFTQLDDSFQRLKKLEKGFRQVSGASERRPVLRVA